MSNAVAVYCSGGIKKGARDAQKLCWGDSERQIIQDALSPTRVVFLNPDDRGDDISDAFTVFGRDHYQVSVADFVVADLREKRGIGVGMEMLSAKWFAKPVISVAPPRSHYRLPRLAYLGATVEDYVHAHLFGVSDAIVDDFAAAGEWILRQTSEPVSPKSWSVLQDAIDAYRANQLRRDTPMLEALRSLGRNLD